MFIGVMQKKMESLGPRKMVHVAIVVYMYIYVYIVTQSFLVLRGDGLSFLGLGTVASGFLHLPLVRTELPYY